MSYFAKATKSTRLALEPKTVNAIMINITHTVKLCMGLNLKHMPTKHRSVKFTFQYVKGSPLFKLIISEVSVDWDCFKTKKTNIIKLTLLRLLLKGYKSTKENQRFTAAATLYVIISLRGTNHLNDLT